MKKVPLRIRSSVGFFEYVLRGMDGVADDACCLVEDPSLQVLCSTLCGMEGGKGTSRDGVRVVQIVFAQFLELCALRKSFLLIWFPAWKAKQMQAYLQNVANQATHEVIFVIQVAGGCVAEDHCINILLASDLPLLSCYAAGSAAFTLQAAEIGRLAALVHSLPPTSPLQHCDLSNEAIVSALLSATPEGVPEGPAMKVFIAGDRSSVGKSSVCWALVAALVDHYAVAPQALAYIKPATQCEAPQPIAEYCSARGVDHVGVGPVVFYAGFTRAFLSGQTESAAQLLAKAEAAVSALAQAAGRRLVLVDGVGYPAVGSIVGLSNASVASALRTPVLLVGRPGVGDAVDSYNLNATYFQHHGVQVLGAVFNKLEAEGFYSAAACREAVNGYFQQTLPQQMPYGFVPKAEGMGDVLGGAWPQHFLQHVQLGRLLHDIWLSNLLMTMTKTRMMTRTGMMVQQGERQGEMVSSSYASPAPPPAAALPLSHRPSPSSAAASPSYPLYPAAVTGVKRTREEVVEEARASGARAGA